MGLSLFPLFKTHGCVAASPSISGCDQGRGINRETGHGFAMSPCIRRFKSRDGVLDSSVEFPGVIPEVSQVDLSMVIQLVALLQELSKGYSLSFMRAATVTCSCYATINPSILMGNTTEK